VNVIVPAGLMAMAAQPAPFALEMNVRSTDRAMVLSWDDPTDLLQTTTDLNGTWEDLSGVPSPYILPDYNAKHRFFRLRREN
jgi:hypothetical protein